MQGYLSATQDRVTRTHPVVNVQSADTSDFSIRKVKAVTLHVSNQSAEVVTLRDDSDTALGRPSQQDLGSCYVTRESSLVQRVNKRETQNNILFL